MLRFERRNQSPTPSPFSKEGRTRQKYVCYFVLLRGEALHLLSHSNYTDVYLEEIKKRYF